MTSSYMASLLLLALATMAASGAFAAHESLFESEDRDRNSSPILSGFILVDNIVMRIMRRINLPSSCLTLKFVGIPANTTSPLVKGPTFHLVRDRLYNGRFGWTNGADYITYFPSSNNEFGTWMLNNNPGLESGYAYLKPYQNTLVPLNSDARWFWLENTKWVEVRDVHLTCEDGIKAVDHFYQVEYYKGMKAQTGFYAPRLIAPDELTAMIATKKIDDFILLRSLTKPSLWNDERQDFVTPKSSANFDVLAKFGAGTTITDSKGRTTVGHLIQQEHSGTGGWSLTFRRVIGSDAEEKKSGWNHQEEVVIILDSLNAKSGNLKPLTTDQEVSSMASAHQSLKSMKKGDYLSVWYHKLYQNSPSSSTYEMVGLDGTSTTVLDNVSDVKNDIVEEDMEVLLECVGATDTRILFKYHLSDRREAMKQSILSKETDYFMHLISSGSDERLLMVDETGADIEVTSYQYIGSDVLGYIRKYLAYKDRVAGGLSSCYFYHAAVTLPRALVYAAEIVCVLIGAKPVTLIQFSTPSDHQWKFPLVSELSHSIVQTKLLMGDAFDVDYKIFRYRNDASLVIYRTNRTYAADFLTPRHESQALHPIPYPNEKNPRPDWEMQIYNAWWNGYVLGYPERFVDSYCDAFHNGLTLEEKRVQSNLARADVKAHLKENGVTVAEIGTGLEPPISDVSWNAVVANL